MPKNSHNGSALEFIREGSRPAGIGTETKVKPRVFALLFLVCSSLGLSGCVSGMLARKIVEAPNRTTQPWPPKGSATAERIAKTYALTFRVAVAPATELAVAIVEPADYSLRYGTGIEISAEGRRRPHYSADWNPQPRKEQAVHRKGTIVLLHGFLMAKESMMHWAVFFAQQGYRAVLVDLRGHGESGGSWITFGATEAGDLVKVMNEIERLGLASDGVGVLGSSYGAVMALHWAARDPRVKAVVAMQPFSDPEKAVMEFAHGFPDIQKLVGGLSDATFAAAIKRAPTLAGFKWADANVMESIRRLRIPVLFYHGTRDTWVLPAHSQTLASAAPAGSRLVLLTEDDHASLGVRLDPIAMDVADWFVEHDARVLMSAGGAAASPVAAPAIP
ncbi:MAG TPA: alpha/beta fold hydrolase [Opitutaceae bacterium]|nr:alpha/beta fold hydrolase [Opitutaceae bacterium]